MKSKGIIYFNQGTRCIVRLLVSIYSLRKHYRGSVTVLTKGTVDISFKRALILLDVNILAIDEADNSTTPPLVQKASLWRFSPYDITMFIDADTIIVDKCFDNYFNLIEEHGFVTGSFADWQTRRGSINKRIKAHSTIRTSEQIDKAIAYGKATNTGVFGFSKESRTLLEDWEKVTKESYSNNCSRIPDELACQLIIPYHKHYLAPEEYGVSVKYHTADVVPSIIHYHGRKHCLDWDVCTIWKAHYWAYYWELYYTNRIEISEYIKQHHGDRRFKEYLHNRDRQDMTFVSMVTPGKYLEKFKVNFKSWLLTESIMEYPIHIYLVANTQEECDLLKKDLVTNQIDKRVKMIEVVNNTSWSLREFCFYTFVKQVPYEIDTPLWVKIDADSAPKPEIWNGYGYLFNWDRGTRKSDLTANKWGYTKPGQWLLDLDDWAVSNFVNTPRLFGEVPRETLAKSKRYGHARIASFVCVHNTKFTKEAAKYVKDRLPVPSHDTFLWFVATKLNKKIKPIKMKRWFSSNGYVPPENKILLIDGGYHKGVFTKQFLKEHPGSKTLAFEPNTAIVPKEVPKNTTIFPYALSPKSQRVFYKATREDACSLIPNKYSTDELLDVDCVSLLDYLDTDYQIHLKLDVEGSEYEILEELEEQNMLQTIHTIYIEWHLNIYPKAQQVALKKRKNTLIKQLMKQGVIIINRK